MTRLPFLLVLILFAAGCGKNINNKDAVRQGVVDYLSKRMSQTGLDMNLMNVEVSSVSFQKNEARATVAFKPKGADAAGGMSMNYVLERRGDQWVVKGRQESGLNPHGGGGLPPAMPGDGGNTPAGALPPNHPPVDQAKPEGK